MNKMQKLASTGLVVLTIGLSLMVLHENQRSQAQSKMNAVTSPKIIIPEKVYLGLNHIENDLNRLKVNIQGNETLGLSSESTNSKLELVAYRETQLLLTNLISWLKEKQLLFRNDLSRSVPGFPLEERLKDDAILNAWKNSLRKGLVTSSLQVNNLRINAGMKTEIKKRLSAISNEAKKIGWLKRSVSNSASSKDIQLNASLSIRILNQIQNTLSQLDKDILSLSQATFSDNSNTSSTKGAPWIAWIMAFSGLAILAYSIFRLNKDKSLSSQQVNSVTGETISKGLTIPETAILDRLNQAIFYLSGNYDILWANAVAKKMLMTKNDLSAVLKNAYKDEEGKRVSSFNNSDYWLDVEYLDQKMADGNKIYCLIMAQVIDSTSQLKINSAHFESPIENSMDQLDFDFTQMVRDLLGNMSYLFKLSGTEFKFHTDDVFQCICEMNKVESASKTLLSAVHQLIKDDFEAKAVVVKITQQNGRLHLSSFVPSLIVDSKQSQFKKLAYQAFLEEMVKVERQLLPYGARVILRQQSLTENEPSGFFIELSFANKNIYADFVKNNQVTV